MNRIISDDFLTGYGSVICQRPGYPDESLLFKTGNAALYAAWAKVGNYLQSASQHIADEDELSDE